MIAQTTVPRWILGGTIGNRLLLRAEVLPKHIQIGPGWRCSVKF